MDMKPTVPGFLANGVHAGLKEGGRKDLSLIYSKIPAMAAAVFTTNDFKAAPVLLSMERIKGGWVQAIIINSGNANAATGEQGYQDAVAMSRAVADGMRIDPDRVLVASTGKIGTPLPTAKIVSSVPELISGLAADRIVDAEEGIMTTDKFPKIEYCKGRVGSKEVTICGIAKGAGMIEPNMATMLTFIMTDAMIEREALDLVFGEAVAESFNAISVDGCMSTNDTAIVLANGIAGNDKIVVGSEEYQLFSNMLKEVMVSLAKSIVRDGEGSTKVIEVVVEEAATLSDAKKIAYAVAQSSLVKTAFYGKDPNWGRIISAAGSVGLSIPIEKMEVYLETIPVFKNGGGVSGHHQELVEIMQREAIRVNIRLGMGMDTFRLFTSDLSHEYVHINADYHT